MDQKGDEFDTQSMANGVKSININQNSTEILNELLNEMKDKCESMVNNSDDNNRNNIANDSSSDIMTNSDLLRRLNDSEAEDNDERNDNRSDVQRDDASDETVKAVKDKEETIKVTIVRTETNEPTTGLTLHGKPNKQMKPRTEKWGESVGIVDESGRVRRVITLEELHNYLLLETWTYKIDSKIYCSLINERYPRFFDSTIDYLQRWRMRYNIFVDKVLADKSDHSLVHMGELHLYFDLIPKFSNPYYVNNSFYSNPNEAEKPLDVERYHKMKASFDSLRKSQSIFQLKFPIRLYLFHSTDYIFEKFRERHHEIMDESRAVQRKAGFVVRKQRQKSTVPPIRGGMPQSDRQFGQSSRDFHQTGRQFPRNERKFSETGPERQGFPPPERQGIDETQRGFPRNRRGFGRRGQRSFIATNRKPFNAKPKNDGLRRRRNDSENSYELDVTFEDTSERHERKSSFGKPRKPMNRNDRQVERMDPFRDNRDPPGIAREQRNPKVGPNNQPIDSERWRQNKESFKVRDNHFSTTLTSGPFFSGNETMDTNRRRNSSHSYGQPIGFGRYD